MWLYTREREGCHAGRGSGDTCATQRLVDFYCTMACIIGLCGEKEGLSESEQPWGKPARNTTGDFPNKVVEQCVFLWSM
jgi:hypothetical protein